MRNDIIPSDPHFSRHGWKEASQNAHHRALASAIRAKKTYYLTPGHLKRSLSNSKNRPETLTDVINLNHSRYNATLISRTQDRETSLPYSRQRIEDEAPASHRDRGSGWYSHSALLRVSSDRRASCRSCTLVATPKNGQLAVAAATGIPLTPVRTENLEGNPDISEDVRSWFFARPVQAPQILMQESHLPTKPAQEQKNAAGLPGLASIGSWFVLCRTLCQSLHRRTPVVVEANSRQGG